MPADRRIRPRWDRIGFLVVTAVTCVLLVRPLTSPPSEAAVAGRTGPTDPASATAAAVPVVEASEPRPGCAAGSGGPVTSAPGAGRTVALTFDDGPSEWTVQVLDILDHYDIKATFFVVGSAAEAHPDVLSRVVAAGHQVGNHTWSHVPAPAGGASPEAWLAAQYDPTDALLTRLSAADVCWYRPPRGEIGAAATVAADRGLGIAMWSVDSLDWQVQSGAEADPDDNLRHTIGENAVAGLAEQHPIVLLHDGGGYRGATVAALPYIIERYDNRGYDFVRIDGR